MSRTISQIDIGTSIWVREANADVEYILMRKDAVGCELLRKQCYEANDCHHNFFAHLAKWINGCAMNLQDSYHYSAQHCDQIL